MSCLKFFMTHTLSWELEDLCSSLDCAPLDRNLGRCSWSHSPSMGVTAPSALIAVGI